MISQSTIEQIFSTASIVEVIRDFLSLTKAGVNYNTCCPFHDDKTPSFVVSPVKNIYHCFGCGESGGAVGFLQKYKSYTYPEALKYLAKKYDIEIKEETQTKEQKKKIDLTQKIYHINKLAARHFYENLWKPENALALEYALSRFSKEILIHNGIGFAPNSWDDLLKYFKDKAV